MHSLFRDQSLAKAEEESFRNEVHHRTSLVATTPGLLQLPSHCTNRTRSLLCLLGSKSGTDNRARKSVARPQLSSIRQQRVLNSINDNYCVKCVTQTIGLSVCVQQGRQFEPFTSVSRKEGLVCNQQERDGKFTCKLLCCQSCSFYRRVYAKKGVNPINCHYTEIKHVKDASSVGHLSSVNFVTYVPTVATDLPVGATMQQFWENCAALGASPKL